MIWVIVMVLLSYIASCHMMIIVLLFLSYNDNCHMMIVLLLLSCIDSCHKYDDSTVIVVI